MPFFISTVGSIPPVLPEVRDGEVWRLFTPIFIHFGMLHILFNMLWLKDLGSAIEKRHGAMFFLALVLSVALTSDLAQYFIAGPYFGGMSGVVYGLFAYIWLRGKMDPLSGFMMPSQTVFLMMLWFVICLTGKLGPVANAAHGVGLIVGAIWGVVSGKLAPTVVIRGPFEGIGRR
jgi:GlpG protein